MIGEFSRDDLNQLAMFDGYITRNELQAVEPMLVNYLKDHPISWRAYQDLGYVYYRMHNPDASIKALTKCLELNSNNADGYKILALDLALKNRYDLAQTELERAAHLDPDSAEIHFCLGRVYLTRSFLVLAKRELEAAIRLNPTYIKAYENLGLTMEALGDNAAALENYQKGVQLDDQQGLNSEWPYFDLAKCYSRLNNPSQALTYYQKALEKSPRLDQAYFEIGKAYRSRREWQHAAEALRRAIEINPGAAQYYYVLSYVYRKLGDLKRSDEEAATFRKLYYGPADSARTITEPTATDLPSNLK